jgi:uncharacterized protein YcbX
MSTLSESESGAVVALWRYPVKSMLGEELNATTLGPNGLLGDRSYAIVDLETGKVASAKNPKKWPHLFDCRASFIDPPDTAAELPPVRIALPDGRITRTDEPGFDGAISEMLGRPGALQMAVPDEPMLEEYWPDIEGLSLRETVTDETLPAGTVFDCATVHLLTTATLARFGQLYPEGRFEVRRFRPNIVVGTAAAEPSFVESTWVDRTLCIGEEVRLKVTKPCGRCVMTTLPQSDLPADPGILRTAARHNSAHVGVYAEVIAGGSVRRGDVVRVE